MKGIYKEMISNKQKDYMKQLQKDMDQFDSVQDFKSDPTTIITDMDSQFSIKCLSFKTEIYLVENKSETLLSVKSSLSKGDDSVQSHYFYKKKIQDEIQKDLNKFKQHQIQTRNAKNLFRNFQPENNDYFMSNLVQEIEKFVCSYRNFDLFQDILTKEKDETFKFKNMLLIAKSNLNSIFKEYEVKDFDVTVIDLIQNQKIQARPLPDKQKTHEKLHKSSHPSQDNESDRRADDDALENSSLYSSHLNHSRGSQMCNIIKQASLGIKKQEADEEASFQMNQNNPDYNFEDNENEEQTHEKCQDEKVELDYDVHYQNWIYSKDCIRRFEYINIAIRKKKKKQQKLEQMLKMIESQQKLIEKIKKSLQIQ